MNKQEYRDYLHSKHWKEFKKRFKRSKLCKHKCYICGQRYNIHIHHKTYKNLGHERLMGGNGLMT